MSSPTIRLHFSAPLGACPNRDLPPAQEHNITAMPTFQFWKAGLCLDTIVGADARKLQEQVQLHAATI